MRPGVFIDSVALLALWERTDKWHMAAAGAFGHLIAENAILATTSYVLLEGGNAAARKPYRDAPEMLRQRLEADKMVIHPTTDDWQAAWTAYHRGEAGGAGIVDQFSFIAMRRMGIQRAFTNDKHFRAAGFEVLF